MKKRRVVLLISPILIVLTLVGILMAARSFNRSSADAEDVVVERFAPDGTTYWQIAAGPANAWLLPAEDGYFLIDTGYPGDYERFVAGLNYVDIDVQSIRHIFITHSHDEHAGFAARLKKETGAILILPDASLANLASGRFDWNGMSVNWAVHLLAKAYNLVTSRDFLFDPVLPSSEDVILNGDNDQTCREWGVEGRFVYTPGHSSDSWSLIMDDGRAFIGDAAMNTLQFFGTEYRPLFMEDRLQTYESIDRIRQEGAKIVLTGHGDPFSVEDLPAYLENTSIGPGLSALPLYFLRLAPGFLLIFVLLMLGRNAGSGYRVWIYIIGFILIRDLMTPMGLWTLGGGPVFWMRFSADGLLLIVLAFGSLVMALGVIFLERRKGSHLPWFNGKVMRSILAGFIGVAVVVLPVILSYQGILPGERGGQFPIHLVPAVFAVALAANLLEELLFRGYLQSWYLDQGLRPVAAAIGSGLTFGLCHTFLAYTVTDAGLGLLLFATWEGIICGLLRHRFGLASAVITHGFAVAVLAVI